MKRTQVKFDALESKSEQDRKNIYLGLFFFLFVGIMFSDRLTFTNYYLNYGSGRSMCPALGSFSVTISSKDVSDLKVGDIITFSSYDEEFQKYIFIEHRIIDKQYNTFLIKGDNNPIVDGWFIKDEIKSKLIYNLNLWRC